MLSRIWFALPLAGLVLLPALLAAPAPACCPAFRTGQPVLNADQTVILIWDAATKTQHFIRKASFSSAADDFGFIVPTPNQPNLAESGNDAFGTLQTLTAPEVKQGVAPRGIPCGCSAADKSPGAAKQAVQVLEEKVVAGFQAVVLEATSAQALVAWLNERGYVFSPEVEAWAKPYIDAGWKFTALRVAKDKDDKDGKDQKTVTAKALRLSFQTDRPLFPYREPDPKSAAAVEPKARLLRIYFLADGRYRGELTKETPWTGKVAWAGKVGAADRTKVLKMLDLPENTGPVEWYLTEFEDHWPYRVAPADVFFARDADQGDVRRDPVFVAAPLPMDLAACAVAAALVLPPLVRRVRRGPRACRGRGPGIN